MEIHLKWGIVKSYNLNNEQLVKTNEQLVKDFNNIFDEFYKDSYSALGSSENNKNNQDLKIRLCDLLDKLFDLGVAIRNDYDNKKYRTKKSYRKYILEYGND